MNTVILDEPGKLGLVSEMLGELRLGIFLDVMYNAWIVTNDVKA